MNDHANPQVPDQPIRLSSPTDVLDAVPYLLGYHPTESLVVLILDTTRLYCTARVDLPTDDHTHANTLIGLARAAHGHSAVVLIAYSADEHASDTTLAYFGENWPAAVAPIDAMLAANPAGWAVVDQGVEEIGTPRQAYDTDHRVAAEAVTRGLGVANLDEMTEQVMALVTAENAATLAAELALVAPVVDGMTSARRSQEARDTMQQWNTLPVGPPPASLVAYLLAMIGDDRQVLDDVMLALDTDTARTQEQLWTEAARYVDGPTSWPVLALWGITAWLSGDGAKANRIHDRAVRDGGQAYGAIRVLGTILEAVMPPSAWARIREEIREQLGH